MHNESSGATGDANFQGAPMSTDDQNNFLSDELERALRQATDRTMGAFTSLRRAVREHVHYQRDSGNGLDEIQLQLRTISTRAMDGIGPVPVTAGDQGNLNRQIMQWSSTFYMERGGAK